MNMNMITSNERITDFIFKLDAPKGNYQVYKDIQKGIRHENNHLACQDYADVAWDGRKVSIALADGQGKTDINAAAMVEIVNKINEFLLTWYERMIDWNEEVPVIVENFMLQIRRLIEQMSSRWNVTYRELSSTLLGCCIDFETNTYCAVHLGDGVILVKNKYKELEVLSEPFNGIKENETILSTSENTLRYVKIYRGSLQEIKGVILASDGVYKDILDLEKMEKYYTEGRRNGILDHKTEDDQAVIMLKM